MFTRRTLLAAAPLLAALPAAAAPPPDSFAPFVEGVKAEALRKGIRKATLEAAFAGAREKFGQGGPFLFGEFSAADAMFAPVVNRLHTYDVPVRPETRAYMQAMMALPAWAAWVAGAKEEPWSIAHYDAI